jgi:hypothetical protein
MRRSSPCPSLLAFALLGAGPLAAQTPGREPAVVELPAGARAAGLGHAFQADAGDSDAVFWNPALASRAGGFALGLQGLTTAARAFTVSAAAPWYGGGVAVGLQALEYGTDVAPGEREGGIDPLLADGGEAVGELVATVAYGRTLAGFTVGVAGKLVDQRFGDARQQDLAADVGVAHALGPGWASLAVRNLGPERSLDGVDVRLPTDVTLGWGGYGRPLGPLDLGAAAALGRRADGEVVFGGGLELGYWPVQGRTFVARVGVRNVPEGEASPVTFGGSFWGDRLVLEYAFQPVDDADGLHRVTLGWR